LIIGFSVQFIDNGGHIGGLVTGVILALVIPYLPPSAKGRSASGWAILAVCILVIGLSFAATLRQLPRHLGWRVNAVNSYLNGVQKVEESARKIESASAGAPGTETSSISDAVTALQNITAPDQRSAAIRDEMLQTLRRRQELIRSGATPQELHSNLEALDATLQKFDDWYKTDLQRQAAQHGLRFEQKGSQ
jgi:hypothetical protein